MMGGLSSTDEFDDELTDEEQQKIAAKLLRGYRPASVMTGMSDPERAMAEKLLGRTNTERLARTGRDERFKYRKPVHTAEYWQEELSSNWHVDIFENGRRQSFKRYLTEHEVMTVVNAMRAKGIPVRLFETEGQKLERARIKEAIERPSQPRPRGKPCSDRMIIINSLKDFRL